MALGIRAARTADARDIARLTGQLGYDVTEAVVADRLSRILSRSDQQFLVAERDGRIVGWVHEAIAEFVEAGAFAVIGGLVVDRRYRQKGIGRALMDRAEQWAAQQGCSVVRLWSSVARTAAHGFYEHLGYTNVKTQHSFVKPLDRAGQEALRDFVPRVDQ